MAAKIKAVARKKLAVAKYPYPYRRYLRPYRRYPYPYYPYYPYPSRYPKPRIATELVHSGNIVPMGENYHPQKGWY